MKNEVSKNAGINKIGELVYRCEDCGNWSSETKNGQCAFCWYGDHQPDRNDYPDDFDPDLYDL